MAGRQRHNEQGVEFFCIQYEDQRVRGTRLICTKLSLTSSGLELIQIPLVPEAVG